MIAHEHNRERDPFEKLLLQSDVLKKLGQIHRDFKADVTAKLEPGDKRTVKNAQGLELGSVSMSSPSKKAVCTDRSVLLAMADENGLEIVDDLPSPEDPRYTQIIDLLITQGREDLLESNVCKDDLDSLSAEVLERWQIDGSLPVGWEIKDASVPRVSISVKRTAAVRAAIDHLVQEAGAILEITNGKGE